MKKEQEAASKREGRRSGTIADIFLPTEDFSAPGPSAAGRVNVGPSTAGRANAGPSTAPRFNTGPLPTVRSPSVVATLNTTPSFAGLTNISLPNSVGTFISDFNLDDVSDDGDVAKGAITPNDFLRFASGATTTQADKPLPPLPLNVSCILFIPTRCFAFCGPFAWILLYFHLHTPGEWSCMMLT